MSAGSVTNDPPPASAFCAPAQIPATKRRGEEQHRRSVGRRRSASSNDPRVRPFAAHEAWHRTVATRSTTLVAVCRKCGKKLGGGFGDGGRQSLAKALKQCSACRNGSARRSASSRRVHEAMPKGAVAVTASGDPRLVSVIPARRRSTPSWRTLGSAPPPVPRDPA